jgi:hypothetical protein
MVLLLLLLREKRLLVGNRVDDGDKIDEFDDESEFVELTAYLDAGTGPKSKDNGYRPIPP